MVINESLILETMKKAIFSFPSVICISVFILLLYVPGLNGQEAGKPSPALPDNINKIVSVSCVPCHTDKGGIMSRGKLNFTNWTQYSPEKQKEKADFMSSVLEKDKMPPKSARKNRPEIIPTKEQKEAIKKWAESVKPR